MRVVLSLISCICFLSCSNGTIPKVESTKKDSLHTVEIEVKKPVYVQNGDLQLSEYLPLLQNKKVGLVVNQSSILGSTHLIDTLLSLKVDVKKIFAPEHGIRGNADAGEKVTDGIDSKSGLPIVSLYGNHKKPLSADLAGLDVIVFDLQDVGVRFFTYISTMHYVMEACAENKIPVIILDRPNPNGDYIAGPIMEDQYKSFVGMHSIPIVHGLTVGELALMINGEKWLKDAVQTDVKIIKCKNYTHDSIIPLAVKPSPNLPNINSIRWYPSTCLFEETQVSVGRGTYTPFEIYGGPFLNPAKYTYTFTPISIDGMSKMPPFENKLCYGQDLTKTPNKGELQLELLIDAYNNYKGTLPFFAKKNFTYKLCGTTKIVDAIENGTTAAEINLLFEKELTEYKKMRANYLLYKDFDEK